MRRSIIIIWGILLLIKQGAIIGSEKSRKYSLEALVSKGSNPFFIAEPVMSSEELDTYPRDIKITVLQGDISEAKNVGAIVNPEDFSLSHGGEIAKKLASEDSQWEEFIMDKLLYYQKNHNFKDGGQRAIVTPTFALKTDCNVPWIINVVAPKGDDKNWKRKLERSYDDILKALIDSDGASVTNLAFPVDIVLNKTNKKGKVIITPEEIAKAAVGSISKLFDRVFSDTCIENIDFVSKVEDYPVYSLAFLKALGLLPKAQEKEYKDLKNKYIKDLEQQERRRKFINHMKKKVMSWKGVLTLGTFAALFYYIVNKYRSSR